MNAYIDFKIFKKKLTPQKEFYFCCYSVRVNKKDKNDNIISNYFSLGVEELKTFIKVLNNLPDENPRMINLKINDMFHKYCNLMIPNFINKEYLTPKEKELGIRSLVVKKTNVLSLHKFANGCWEYLYSVEIKTQE